VTDRREFDRAGEAVEVSFADPDEAVRERVRELGLSSAARTLDETVRESKTPDSRVADDVEQRVRDLVEGEASAFRPAPDVSETTAEQTGTAAEKLAGDGGDTDADADGGSDTDADADGDANTDGESGAGSTTGTAEAEVEESGTDGQGSLGDFA
jgi:exonuclease SbcD